MKTFLKILQSESSKLIHLSLLLGLYIEMEKSIVLMLFFGLEVLFLLRRSKNVLLLGLIVLVAFQLRMSLIQNPSIDLSQTTISGQVMEIYDQKLILKTDKGNIMVYASEELYYLPGDTLELDGHFFETDSAQIKHTFDYLSYLESLKIRGQFYASKLILTGHVFNLKEIRTRVAVKIEETHSYESGAYLKMFVLGDDSSVSETDLQKFRNLGIAHLFAISGMHVGLILLMTKLILSMFYIKESTEKSITFLVLLIYNVLTGFSVSILRASLLVVLLYLNKKNRWFFSKTDLLSFIFILFLFYEPAYLSQAGFQLSFLITFAILLSEPLLKGHKRFVQLIRLQLIATLFSLPIILNMNQGYGLLSIFASIFFLEVITFILIPLSFVTVLIPQLGGIYETVIKLFSSLIHLFDAINPWIAFQFPSMGYVALFYCGAIYLMVCFISHKKFIIPITMIIYSILFASIHPYNPLLSKVVFLDVGQGDATYIQSLGCHVLIDTGPKDDYDDLIHYLKGENVNRIDAIFISHFHSDHYGELSDLVDALQIGHVYASHTFEDFPYIEVLSTEDEVKCGKILFEVLHSNSGDSNENNNSLVLSAEIEGDHYLFMGDLESEEEFYIQRESLISIDVLKVGHHGSDTSSSIEFISAIQPALAIISVGENNYGQPSPIVIERLKETGATVFQTKTQGSISINYYSWIHLRTVTHYICSEGILSQRLIYTTNWHKRLLL